MEYKAQTGSYESYQPGIKILYCVMPGGCFMVVMPIGFKLKKGNYLEDRSG